MGFFSDVAKGWATYVLPASGAIAGGAVGGPAGAMIGGSLGSIPGQIIGQKDAERKQREANERNEALQREFAQNGIRWKVADAKAAGIHPLAALGAQTTSYQSSTQPEPSMLADMSARMGQDVSRAVSATRTSEERALAQLQIQGAQLELEGRALDNQLKQSQLQKLQATGPGIAGQSFIPGQGNGSALITNKPLDRTASHPQTPYAEPGAITDTGWIKTPTGVIAVPSKDAKERIEDVMPHEWSHFIRNNVAPNFGGGPKPPKDALPKGFTDWEWQFDAQEWRAVRRKTVPYGGREADKSPYSAPTSSRGYRIERR